MLHNHVALSEQRRFVMETLNHFLMNPEDVNEFVGVVGS
jgi:hypothetical protein